MWFKLFQAFSSSFFIILTLGDLEVSMKSGNLSNCLEFIQKTLESSENTKSKFVDFTMTPISLKCKYGKINVEISPTKNWIESGYDVIYEASTGLTKDSLKW